MATVIRSARHMWSFPKVVPALLLQKKMKENFPVGKVSKEQKNQQCQKTGKNKKFVTNNDESYHVVTLKHNSITKINDNCLMLIRSTVQPSIDTWYFSVHSGSHRHCQHWVTLITHRKTWKMFDKYVNSSEE